MLPYEIPVHVSFYPFSPNKKKLYSFGQTFRPKGYPILQNKSISDGTLTLLISFICLSKYAALDCLFEAGSNMSPTWGETADIVGIHDACVIGVDLARGITILVVPGRSVHIGRLHYGILILQRVGLNWALQCLFQ